MNIAIIGTGAMGSLLAGTLAREHDVTMFGRWKQQVDTINAYGLALQEESGNRINLPIPVDSHPERHAGTMDVALTAVKATHTSQAARDAQVVLSPHGLGVSFQNGLGNLEILREELGAVRTTVAVTAQGATLVSPGLVRHAGHGLTTIGRLPQLGATQVVLVKQLCDALNRSGWVCTIEDDLELLMWRKLAVNAAINPLTAILGIPNGRLLERPEWAAILRAAAAEVARVAIAKGIALDEDEAAGNAVQVAHDTAGNVSSMLQDVTRNVPTEIEAINGQVVMEARKVGIVVPVNETMLTLVRQIDAGAPNRNVAEFLSNLALSTPSQEIPNTRLGQ